MKYLLILLLTIFSSVLYSQMTPMQVIGEFGTPDLTSETVLYYEGDVFYGRYNIQSVVFDFEYDKTFVVITGSKSAIEAITDKKNLVLVHVGTNGVSIYKSLSGIMYGFSKDLSTGEHSVVIDGLDLFTNN